MSASNTRATAREWTGLAVLALPTLLISIDVSVILLALPRISETLGADSAQQLWIMDIYGFLLAGFLITMGTIGDRIGRRKLLMIGGAAFAAASVLAAFSTSVPMLIAARGLLGIAGATLSPSILALITNMFHDERQRGFAISIWLTCFMGGMLLGPLVGGVMLEHFWWGAPFLLGVPVMLLLLVTAPALLPEYKAPQAGRLDLVSVVLSLGAILPVVYGLKELAKGDVSLAPFGAIGFGVLLAIVFIRRQVTLAHPLVDLKLFRNGAFTAVIGAMFLITVTGAIMVLTAQYFQLVAGLSPLWAGLCGLPAILLMIIAFMLAPKLAQTIRPGLLIASGMGVAIIGLLIVLFFIQSYGVPAVIVGFALFNLGCAPMVTLGTGIMMGFVEPERAGAAAALQETSSEFGFSLGIASLGSLGTLVYRGMLSGTLPAGLTEAETHAATETLAGAASLAASLPDGAPLLTAASAAFTAALQLVVAVEAGILLLIAIVALTALRGVKPLGAGAGADPTPLEAETEDRLAAAQ